MQWSTQWSTSNRFPKTSLQYSTICHNLAMNSSNTPNNMSGNTSVETPVTSHSLTSSNSHSLHSLHNLHSLDQLEDIKVFPTTPLQDTQPCLAR